jgi:hypothetical protein
MATNSLNKRLLDSYTLRDLQRLRWAVGVVMLIGVAASIVANVLHANPHPISQTIAAWPPVAFLATVEVVSRVPVHRPLLATGRILATVVITVIAGWISYGHMRGVAVQYGETGWAAVLLPLSVDGLVVVASLSLVELAGAIKVHKAALPRPATASASPVTSADPGPAPARVPAPTTVPAAASDRTVPAVSVAATSGDAAPAVGAKGHDQADAAGGAGGNGHAPHPGRRATPAGGRHGEQVQARVPGRSAGGGQRYQMPRDEARLERLRELARASLDGKVGVREAARELGVGVNSARRLLQMADLYRSDDPHQQP